MKQAAKNRVAPYVLAGAVLVGGVGKALAEDITIEDFLNPYAQPNSELTQSYGSGDINQDGKVNQADLDSLYAGVKNDFSDVDGDSIPSTQNDASQLELFLNREIEHWGWNSLQNKEYEDSLRATTRDQVLSCVQKVIRLSGLRSDSLPFVATGRG